MRIVWKIIRALVSALLLAVVFLPTAAYVLLSLESVQNAVRQATATELSELLGAQVDVEKVNIRPFRLVSVQRISAILDGDTVASVATVSAGIELRPLFTEGRIVIDYALIDDLKLRVTRPTPDGELNIAPIIARLKGDDRGEKKPFNLEINTAIVRRASASYDVLSEPAPDTLQFCPNHIRVENLAINAYIPKITEREYQVSLDHLSFDERSGFSLEKLTGKFEFTDHGINLSDFAIVLPNSRIAFEPSNLEYDATEDLMESFSERGMSLCTERDCSLYIPDFKAFAPLLGKLNNKVEVDIDIHATPDRLSLRMLHLEDKTSGAFSATFHGYASDFSDIAKLRYALTESNITINGLEAAQLLGDFASKDAMEKLSRIPDLRLNLIANGTVAAGKAELHSEGTSGKVSATASYSHYGVNTTLSGDVAFRGFNIGLLSGNEKLGLVDATAKGNVSMRSGKLSKAKADAVVERFDFNGYSYHDAKVALDLADKNAEISLVLNDPCAGIHAYGFYNYGDHPSLSATALANHIDLDTLGFYHKRPNELISMKLFAEITNFSPSSFEADIRINDFAWVDKTGKGLKISSITADATVDEYEKRLMLSSPYISGELRGEYNFKTLVPTLKGMVAHFAPALEWQMPDDNMAGNDFRFDFDIKSCADIAEFLNLPVAPVYDGIISGSVDSQNRYAHFNIDIPYISQGKKLIEHTSAFAELDIARDHSQIYLTTQMPTKKGDMTVSASITAADNKIDTQVDWGLDRRIPLFGTIGISAELHELVKQSDARFPVAATIDLLPSTINFGDDLWTINRSQIKIGSNAVEVHNFALDAAEQHIKIDGTAGDMPNDILNVALDDIRLIHIFETLEINNVLIDGSATGNISAKNLFTKEPILECPRLHVDSIGYNNCYFGDADIKAHWKGDSHSIYLDADINGFEGKKSHIYGDIFPLASALDFNFEADSIPVGFLRPFMAAFTSSISGAASGKCRLFGTFSDIDLEGDIYADDVKIKVDFTNVSYLATDSVHIRPGKIMLDNITVRDVEGNTALLNGYVGHTFFRAPVFKFDITECRSILGYNTNASHNPIWYGKIYGNGSASVSGRPGVVNINVDMSTAPRSSFTFVLSDQLDAEDYSFLNFRDVTPDSMRVVTIDNDPTPQIIRQMKQQLQNNAAVNTSDYNMDIRVTATPDASMTLVVDPVAGDEIKAYGDGSIHMVYLSANNDLNIWGKYTVNNGKYRFTLQDIIIKDFTIKEGSEIRFDGDPYAVKTDLSAYYATNATLTDLDESFQQDKDVARTNVPVHAVMNVSGDIRQPSIDFDLNFPTLTSDTYRKVKSIVSTPDMMNRQIIYLLALNRFYTPEYMGSTTRGSELFSVASSTISSQLGNMLGKLSDNWSIAPNLRSDRGDFSDVEVDVALSSRLLNNRLIFNGNFGYRDQALNNDQFIGDFDIEYLLNKSGTWRLKAYNRYNDRNYYVRSALTTQGVGIMFRRDFDSLLSFLRRKSKEKK